MTAHKRFTWLVAGLLICTTATLGRSQTVDWLNHSGHDLQFFSPTEIDFDCRPLRKDCGYYFRYDKLSWAFTGEHVEIGDPDLVVMSEIIFPDTPASQGTPLLQYQINNSIQDAPPDAEFAWGERYELGYKAKDNTWLIGILDGPQAISSAEYGFNQLELPNQVPLSENNDNPNFGDLGFTIGVTGFFRGGLLEGSNDTTTSHNGFGSVHVNFATPAGFLLGLRDYSLNIIGPDGEVGQGPTIGGPGLQVVAITVEGDTITEIDLSTGGDGIIDNLDGDAIGPFFFVIDPNTEEVLADGVDFDDFHQFNIRFDKFFVRNITETQGIEIMRDFDLSNNHKMAKHQGHQATIGCGVRYLRLRDAFYWEGRGDVLGRTFADTKSQNSIVGPQIRAQYAIQRGRWNWALDGRCLFGYNINDLDQVGGIGEDLVPGGVNTLASGQPHFVSYGKQENFFSPVAELRAECSYQFTSSIALRLGYTGTFVDNITRASQTVNWFIPDLGIRYDQAGKQEIYINGVDFGFNVIY